MTVRIFTGNSRESVEQKLDALERSGKKYRPEVLIVPVSGASRYDYNGFSVREWHCDGNVRYDCAVEVEDEV